MELSALNTGITLGYRVFKINEIEKECQIILNEHYLLVNKKKHSYIYAK